MFISRKEIKRFGVKRKQRRNKIQYNSFKDEWNDIYEQISNGIKIRRRCNWYELAKKSIKYFLNLQKSQGCQNILCKICSETQEITDTTRKTIFSFSRRPEKMVFPKKSRWNMTSLVLLGKMMFLFPENMILHLRRKMKDDISQKNTRKYDIFFKTSEKMVFSKGPRRDMVFLVLSGGKMVFFSPKTWCFFLGRKWEKTFLKKYMEIWYFLCTRTGVTNVVWRPSAKKKKNQRWSYPAKMHLKVIDVLDWHPRKSYIGLKFGLFFNLLGWRHSTMNNVQYLLYYSAPTSCVWRCAWAPIKEIICPLGDGL